MNTPEPVEIYCKFDDDGSYSRRFDITQPLSLMNRDKNNIISKWYYKDDDQSIINGPLGYVTGISAENITFSNNKQTISLNSTKAGTKRHWFEHYNNDMNECVDKKTHDELIKTHDELIYQEIMNKKTPEKIEQQKQQKAKAEAEARAKAEARSKPEAKNKNNFNLNDNYIGGKSSRRKRKSRKTKRRSKLCSKRRR